MNKIEALINKLCPNGVEWLPLGKIGRRNKGVNITAEKMKNLHEDNAPVKIFAGGSTVASIPYSAIPSKNIITEPSIIVKSRGYIGFEYYDQMFSHKNELWSYTINNSKIDQKFIYYYLLTQTERLQRLAKATSVKLPQLSVSDTDKLYVPIPPLEIQKEIVKILDKFTQLEAELEAELEARKKQYEYYRDELLTFRDKIKRVKIKDISVNLDSKRKPVTKSARKQGEYPYYGASGIVDYVSEYIFDGEFLLVSEDGANLLARKTPIAFSVSGKSWVNNHAHILKFNDLVTQKYVEIYLNSIPLNEYISGAAQPKLNQKNLNNIEIPFPEFKSRERIVSILDKFDSLVNDISIGLPAELKARRKQYEYYRDKLLTFTPLDK